MRTPMKPTADHLRLTKALSDQEIAELVAESIPHWKAACDNPDADTVVLQQLAFGCSPDELLLMSFAIKYAGIAKKNVMIAS